MQSEPKGAGSKPAPTHQQPDIVVKEYEGSVGRGGEIIMNSADRSRVRVICLQCGYAEEDVPPREVRGMKREHERRFHPELDQRRRELYTALAALDEQIWGKDLAQQFSFDRPAET